MVSKVRELPNAIIYSAGIATIVGVVFAILFGFGVFDRDEPEIRHIGSAEVEPGQPINISGTHLNLIAEVILTKGPNNSIVVPHTLVNESLMTIVISNDVEPDTYNLQAKTEGGRIVSADQTVKVILTTTTSPKREFQITIDSPREKQAVSPSFLVEGAAGSSAPEGFSLWVVMEDDDGDHYAQTPFVPLPDQTWDLPIKLDHNWHERIAYILVVQVEGNPDLRAMLRDQNSREGRPNVFRLSIQVKPLAKTEIRILSP